MILLPIERTRQSALLKFAPAYTPALLFAGIAVMSDSPWYAVGSALFIALHVAEYVFRM